MPSLEEVELGPGGVMIPVLVLPDSDEDLSDDDDMTNLESSESDSDDDEEGFMSQVWRQVVDQVAVLAASEDSFDDIPAQIDDDDSDDCSDSESRGFDVFGVLEMAELEASWQPAVDSDNDSNIIEESQIG